MAFITLDRRVKHADKAQVCTCAQTMQVVIVQNVESTGFYCVTFFFGLVNDLPFALNAVDRLQVMPILQQNIGTGIDNRIQRFE